MMKFLRDPAMQGASFLLTIFVMLIQFPDHIIWLLPLSTLFILLLFLGHRSTTSQNQFYKTSNFGLSNNLEKISVFSKNWIMPSITVLLILLMGFFIVYGMTAKFQQGLVEKIELEITEETESISLYTIIPNSPFRDVILVYKPEIIFLSDESEKLIAKISFLHLHASVEDSGIDPQNIILEPVGNYSTSLESYYDSKYRAFDLESHHTYFVKINDFGLLRIHVSHFPNIPGRYPKDNYLILYVSFVKNVSQRFDGITEP